MERKPATWRNALTLGAALLAAVGAARAGPGDVISSFTIPGLSNNGPRGLAYNATDELYAAADNRGYKQVRIFKFTYDGGAAIVVGSFNCPVAVAWAMDITWRPGRIYVANDIPEGGGTPKIVALDDATGSFTNNFNSPFGANVHVNGLTWDGEYLYASSYDSPRVYRLTTGGSVAASFVADHAANNGLAYDGARLWLVAGRVNYDARRYTTDGVRQLGFGFDVNDEYVGGACWGRPDLHTLFVSTYTGGRYVFELSTDVNTPSVAPASFGKIKALFR